VCVVCNTGYKLKTVIDQAITKDSAGKLHEECVKKGASAAEIAKDKAATARKMAQMAAAAAAAKKEMRDKAAALAKKDAAALARKAEQEQQRANLLRPAQVSPSPNALAVALAASLKAKRGMAAAEAAKARAAEMQKIADAAKAKAAALKANVPRKPDPPGITMGKVGRRDVPGITASKP